MNVTLINKLTPRHCSTCRPGFAGLHSWSNLSVMLKDISIVCKENNVELYC